MLVLEVVVFLLEAIEPKVCHGLKYDILAYHRIQVTMGADSFVALGELVKETGPHSHPSDRKRVTGPFDK